MNSGPLGTLVSSEIIGAVYILGAIAITLMGGRDLINGEYRDGLLMLIAGNLIWRVAAELAIVLFNIHDLLADIDEKLPPRIPLKRSS